MRRRWVLLMILWMCSGIAAGDAYRVTLLRAAPGQLPSLIDQARTLRSAEAGRVLIMRHSQGDHWDLMLLRPGEVIDGPDFRALADFQHEFLVDSEDSWDHLMARADGAGLFHIEMFHAGAGQVQALLEQRRMENAYLAATARAPNTVFVTRFGSDVDCFTLGFYRNLVHFGTDPDLPEAEFEAAARKAGFESRGDIGFHLRRHIIAHHDTLATAVSD